MFHLFHYGPAGRCAGLPTAGCANPETVWADRNHSGLSDAELAGIICHSRQRRLEWRPKTAMKSLYFRTCEGRDGCGIFRLNTSLARLDDVLERPLWQSMTNFRCWKTSFAA